MPPRLFGSYCREMVLSPQRGAYFCISSYVPILCHVLKIVRSPQRRAHFGGSPLGQNVLKAFKCRPNRALWFFMQINTFLKIVLSPWRRAHFGSILEPYNSVLGRSESSWGGLMAVSAEACNFYKTVLSPQGRAHSGSSEKYIFRGNGALASAPCTFSIFAKCVFSESQALASAPCKFWLIRKKTISRKWCSRLSAVRIFFYRQNCIC